MIAAVLLAAATFAPYASEYNDLTAVVATPAEPRRLYVVEQYGRISYLVNGKKRGTFLDIHGRISFGNERGLLGLAFSPSYKKDHRFYAHYTDVKGDIRVVEFRSKHGKAVLRSARRILYLKHQPFPNHNGGQLVFGPDGLLYDGEGDGGGSGDPNSRSQNLSDWHGKILRTNPFVKHPVWHVFAYGLRNPWRFSFDKNGDLYIGDVGWGTAEEVDYRPAARLGTLANYGWNIYEGNGRTGRPGTLDRTGELVFPVFTFDHQDGRCAMVGGFVYHGRAVPQDDGRYFFGDYCSSTIWSLRIENGTAVDVRTERTSNIVRLTSFGEDNAGELYATSGAGKIYKLTP